MSPPNERLQSLPARATADEIAVADQLCPENRAKGVRIALQIARQYLQNGSPRMAGAIKASQLMEQLLPLVRDLEAAAAADAVGTPSGAVFVADPSGRLILQTRMATGAHLVATPSGLMVFGTGAEGSEAAVAIDMAAGVLGLTDLGGAENLNVPLDLPGLAAVVDMVGEAHRQAREAIAQGKPATAARACCPALQLEIRPVIESGNAVIHLGGQSLEIQPLVFLQLLAEAAALLAREVARSVAERQSLEALVAPQQTPVIAWERSHGD